jgi:branched-chain amino acid transport system permease protein
MLENPSEGRAPAARRRPSLLLFRTAARARPRSSTGEKLPHRLPLIEGLVLLVAVAMPLVLASRPELVTLATNVLILAMLAISFDLCWGYSGIMSFGQAFFFGVAGYVIALVGRDLDFSPIWGTLPLATLVGLVLALAMASFLLLGRKTPTTIFVAFGTLTGSYAAERLVSGWQYVGAGNGLSAIKLLRIGSYEMVEGRDFYAMVLALLLCCYSASRWIVRSQFGLVLAGMRQSVGGRRR